MQVDDCVGEYQYAAATTTTFLFFQLKAAQT